MNNIIVPHSKEIEQALLGCVFLDPDIYTQYAEQITPSDFYIHRHGFIWQAFGALSARNHAIDLATVAEELQHSGRLDEIGGAAFLTALLNQVPSLLNAETYARTVKDKALKRGTLTLANSLAEWSLNGKSPAEIVEGLYSEIEKIEQGADTQKEIISAAQAVKRAAQATEDASAGTTNTIPTGLIDLDSVFRGGFRAGKLILIAGRPGDGKSALLDTIAYNAAVLHNKTVGFFSIEMPLEETTNRLIAQASGLPFDQVESGMITDWDKYYKAIDTVAAAPFLFDETPTLTVTALRTKARRMKEAGAEIIFIDPLNYINAQLQGAKEFEKIDYIVKQLKIIARQLELPIVAAHHMNRNIEHSAGDPQLSDLDQAGEKWADVVIFITKSKTENQESVRFLNIAKHRGGKIGKITTIFNAPQTRFESAVTKTYDPNKYPPSIPPGR